MDPLDLARPQLEREREIFDALRDRLPQLMTVPCFSGAGVGVDRATSRPIAVILLTRKAPDYIGVPSSLRVGSTRVPISVLVMPRVAPHRYRPLEMGCSIEACLHNQNVTAAGPGTAGAVVKDANHEPRVLSAGHVFAGLNDDVIQPSTLFGGTNRTPPAAGSPPDPKDNVGSVRLIASGGVDAGIAETTAGIPEVIDLGPPTGTWVAMVGLPVHKRGSMTGVTEGTVWLSSLTAAGRGVASKWLGLFPQVFTGSPPKAAAPTPATAVMNNLFLVRPGNFSTAGDSGSLVMAGPLPALQTWVDAMWPNAPQARRTRLAQALDNRAVGLLIGGGRGVTLCQDITTVLNALSATLVT